jgi:hypothetical protein
VSLAVVTACSFGPLRRDHLEQSLAVVVEVLDERGVHVVDARFTAAAVGERLTGGDGELELDLSQPVGGVLRAPGKLDEPLVLAPGDDRVTVVMLDRQSPSGLRVAYHFGGDTMLGRRYQTPGRDGTAVADDGDGARAVVDDLAPLSEVADRPIRRWRRSAS